MQLCEKSFLRSVRFQVRSDQFLDQRIRQTWDCTPVLKFYELSKLCKSACTVEIVYICLLCIDVVLVWRETSGLRIFLKINNKTKL